MFFKGWTEGVCEGGKVVCWWSGLLYFAFCFSFEVVVVVMTVRFSGGWWRW